jgi:uncharacterized protein
MNVIKTESFLEPVANRNRIISLDVLRGIALLGILLINISIFAMPDNRTQAILQQPGSLNFNIGMLITFVFEGKMRAMFSMVFGAGLILFISDKEKNGGSSAVIFYRRMAWLLVFGLLHAHLLLWDGDILYLYSLCGMGLFFFRNLKPTYLIAAMISIFMVETAINTYFYSHNRTQRLDYLQVEKIEKQGLPLKKEQQRIKDEWLEKAKGFYPDKEKLEKSIEIKRSDYSTIAKDARPGLILQETKQVPVLILDPLAFMFLGMALFRLGFLSGQLDNKIYFRTMLIGYGLGFAIELYAWLNALKFPDQVQFLEQNWVNISIYVYPVERMLLTLGHVSLIMLLLKAGWFKNFFNRFAAVGRMAFSNYILQSIICSFIFLGYGFGYFARIEYYQLFLIVIAIWIFQLIASPIWLTYFKFGPLEWVWRSLTYWKPQPMRILEVEREVRSMV